jgi:hypothetical protein
MEREKRQAGDQEPIQKAKYLFEPNGPKWVYFAFIGFLVSWISLTFFPLFPDCKIL